MKKLSVVFLLAIGITSIANTHKGCGTDQTMKKWFVKSSFSFAAYELNGQKMSGKLIVE